ncbi:DUF3261 domain-containing protein [Amantichitinum ursilacus]|uniref:DUF3261 domain-containing protein n=1 Tax=Amantichitinum ursilacus TaxID=857265 RepID=A0A0N1JTM2_9NEIS|nr:DUF3261 domain-containing protein [Amantichitinum ursilacus]KPC54088.1 hypothetical protein WG78_05545 [Amantichitinum ursilacus]
MLRYIRALLLLVLLPLAGCASLLTRDLPLLQIAPSALGTPRTVQQQTQITWPTGSAVMESVLQLEPDQLTMISSAMGVRLATLNYDGKNLDAQLVPGMKLPPQRILNDLLLIYAQHDALAAALPHGWRVEDTVAARTLWRDDAVAVDIQYDQPDHWQGQAVLHHHQLYYTLTITSSDVQ